MNEFQFNPIDQQEDIESILKYRKKKIAKQQLVFSAILLFILFLIGFYVYRRVRYVDLNGYVQIDTNSFRTPEDIFMLKTYVHIGDLVMPGDTLYSYLYLDPLLEQADVNSIPSVITHSSDMNLRYNTTTQELNILLAQIKELEKQLRVEDHNIRFGLSSNAHKLDLQRELNELKERYKGKRNELALLGKYKKLLGNSSKKTGYSSNSLLTLNDILLNASIRDENLRLYRLAADTAIVTDIMVPDKSIVFKKEEILRLQSLDLEACNLRIVAYVPSDKMDKINNSTKAEIIVNDELSFTGHTAIMGQRTAELPEHLRSNFSDKTVVPLTIFHVDDGQILPFWTLVNDLPVKVRIKNQLGKALLDDYVWFEIGKGVEEASMKRLLVTRKLGNAQKDVAGSGNKYSLTRNRNEVTAGEVAKKSVQKQPDGNTSFRRITVGSPQAGFYIVAGSMNLEENAFKYAEKLYDSGYREVSVIRPGEKHYVCLSRQKERKLAEQQVNKWKNVPGLKGSLWIYEVK
jgi:hypothetical protein